AAFASNRHHARNGLVHEIKRCLVSQRAAAAEARYGAEHDIGPHTSQLLVAQSETVHDSDAIVLDHHVRLCCEIEKHLACLFVLQIQADAAFSPIHGHEVGALLADE